MKPARTALGAVPISVPMPPIVAAYAMAIISTVAKRSLMARRSGLSPAPWATNSMTESAMGTIITVVVVLNTHMLTSPAASMKPPTTLAGLAPTSATKFSAMRRWRPQRCMPSAMMKPPSMRKMMGLA